MKAKEKGIIEKFQRMPWEAWLHRRFYPFVTYLMMKAGTRAAFRTQGLDGQYPIALYDTDDWYGTPEMFELGAKEAERCLQQKNIFQLVKQCEDNLTRGRKEIPLLCASSADPLTIFKQFLEFFEPEHVFIWVAHGAEPYYHRRVKEAVRELVPEEEVEKFIGDVSFPSKKNALAQMADDILAGLSVDKLHQRYAWIKARGGFQMGYTMEEIQEIQQKILSEPPQEHQHPKVPEDLQSLVSEVQELVYLRTLRTDALYEMYYRAMPLLDRFAKSLGIESVKNYISDDLLAGNIEKIPHAHAILKHYDDVIVLKESVIHIHQKKFEAQEVAGIIANKGLAKGMVRIIHTAVDLPKVRDGDIIVTNMTNPAYIVAMRRAAAFVTDEGGITCHAAIIAREMKKPCVIGTKIATKVFKDGDRVEVDAVRGIVRKI